MINKYFQVSSFLFLIISIVHGLKSLSQIVCVFFLLLLQKKCNRILPILTYLQKRTLVWEELLQYENERNCSQTCGCHVHVWSGVKRAYKIDGLITMHFGAKDTPRFLNSICYDKVYV